LLHPGADRLFNCDKARMPQDSRLRDIGAGLPLILFCGIAVIGFGIQITRQWPPRDGFSSYVVIASEAMGAVFLATQLVLTCVRRLPIGKARGWRPRVWAIVGANSSYSLALLPKLTQNPTVAAISFALIVAGTIGSIAALAWLGKGFSIFPQARQLVTNGPYRFVRHPLYLFEQLSLFGICLQYLQPWGLLIAIAGLGLQFPRMRYEEEILTRTFPEYQSYAKAVPLLVPGFYPRAH
jgi:protein-S-isoprenylcysteine O-methyltransferase Ste14